MFRKRTDFGTTPDVEYFHGDMEYIRGYHDFLQARDAAPFSVDDITWNDLDMDHVFRRVNRGISTSGEQVLYHQLRTPALDESEWRRRQDLVAAMEDDSLRQRAEPILARLGCVRRAGPCTPFATRKSGARLALCVILALLLPLSFLAAAFVGKAGVLLPMCAIIVNSMTHELLKRRLGGELDAVNYMVSLARAAQRFRRLGDQRLDTHFAPAYAALGNLKPALRLGAVTPTEASGDPRDLLLTVTLLDLIAFERLRRVFLRHHDDVLLLHDALGRLDAAISIASWRRTLTGWCEPEIDFSPDAPRAADISGIVHPLLPHPVANDLITRRSLLLTGSNASGKSTYLKAAALCALLAQATCTAPARSYRAPACLIYTSMTVSDDLIAGESYYMAEMRSLKRILDAAKARRPLLCAVDEVLRGTNTVERIAASTEILLALDRTGALCLAATHDIELCGLLVHSYESMHFEERIQDGVMLFDYRLRPGPATTRNAIELLALIGLDKSIIDAAHARARRYLETGLWS